MTENLQREKDKWDVNKDGMIDLAEWRAYVEAWNAMRRSATAPGKGGRNPFKNLRRHDPGQEPPPVWFVAVANKPNSVQPK